MNLTMPLRLVLGAVVALLFAASSASVASAAGPHGPGWSIQSVALPTNFAQANNENCGSIESTCNLYAVTATNVGTKPSEGTVFVKGEVPAGVSIASIRAYHPPTGGGEGSESVVTCQNTTTSFECETTEPVKPGEVITVSVRVLVSTGAQVTVLNHAEVQEGSGPITKTSEPATVPNTLNGSTPAFGFQAFALNAFDSNGAPDDQAGDHPGAVTATINYNAVGVPPSNESVASAVEEPKNEIVDLPLGLVGNPLAAARCPESDLNGGQEERLCPANSQIGLVSVNFTGNNIAHLFKLYNVTPEPGYPVMFGFHIDEIPVLIRAQVLPSSDGYYVSMNVPDIPRSTYLKVTGVALTLFGNPSEQDGVEGEPSAPTTFLSNPSSCSSTGPANERAKVEMNSWINPGVWVSREATMYQAGASQSVTGCNLLQFAPSIALAPESTTTDTPTGYEVDLKVPQTPELTGSLSTPYLRNAQITLPEGVNLSPGAADGLTACAERGPEGIELGNHNSMSHEVQEGEVEGPDGLPHVAAGRCPESSQIGTVEVTTPLLANPLHGHIFTAKPFCGGTGQPVCSDAEAAAGRLFRLYLEAEGSGVVVKLEGQVRANPATGQLTVSFENSPQLPFNDLKVRLKGGPRAPLANPQSCGSATTATSLEPWSAPDSGSAATPSSAFGVTGCGSTQAFAPGFLAGTATSRAGSYSPFNLTLTRQDGEQNLSGLTISTPPGLIGMLSHVQRCAEPQASVGACPDASLIGHSQVGAGAGSHPFFEPGEVFLTGPYNNQPFGLSIVTHAVAGPYNLGTIVVRASIHVDPTTAALTVTSDPLPRIIDGVPLRIQTISVAIDKPGFMFNPTNCSQQAVTGTIAGAQPTGGPGSGSALSTRFSATGCQSLPFKPAFTAATAGRASKAGGASLTVKVSSKGGPGTSGEEANIRSVKVDLPKQLPSRLTTLQKACTEAQFNTNPAGCPKESDVGTATARTPVLTSQLIGPAYLVSHGNEAFPDLEIVLQGEGITLVLDGNTQIKHGITSSTFKTVPDAPITSFELKLPTGKFSILGANVPQKAHYDLCGQTLDMPTAITGQNGAVVKQTTKIAVGGCSKRKPQKKAKAKTKRGR